MVSNRATVNERTCAPLRPVTGCFFVAVGFNHTAQRIRDDRKRAAEIASMTAELEGQGLTVVAENVLYYGDLRTADGEPLTIADANAAYIGHNYKRRADRGLPAHRLEPPDSPSPEHPAPVP